MQRVAVDELQQAVYELQISLKETNTAYLNVQQQWEEGRKQLDFAIALRREMCNKGQYYKDSYSWLPYDYQQITSHVQPGVHYHKHCGE